MARISTLPRGHRLFLVGALLAPLSVSAAAEPNVTFTFPPPTKAKAKMTVNADDPGGPPATFTVRVGSTTKTFNAATPAASRTIDVPADPRGFLRVTVDRTGEPPTNHLALIPPDATPVLVTDACSTWDIVTFGGSGDAICVARERHCPTASRPSKDHRLTETQCGAGTAKYCVPDYRVDVTGEKKQKVRLGVANSPGKWITLTGAKVYHLTIPSEGKCPGIVVESGAEKVRVSLASGQHVLIRVGAKGEVSAEDVPNRRAAEVSD